MDGRFINEVINKCLGEHEPSIQEPELVALVCLLDSSSSVGLMMRVQNKTNCSNTIQFKEI